MRGKNYDFSGQKYGAITVVRFAYSKQIGNIKKRFWECKCDCGKTVFWPTDKLNDKFHRSCGCDKHPGNFRGKKYPDVPPRLCRIYWGMISRCNIDPHYVSLGITVCDLWRDNPKAFFDWSLSNGYADDLSIDRINTYGNYEPRNCRWADRFTQANNKTDSRYLTIDGITHTAKEWEIISGIKASTIIARANYGKSGKDLLKPLHQGVKDAKV